MLRHLQPTVMYHLTTQWQCYCRRSTILIISDTDTTGIDHAGLHAKNIEHHIFVSTIVLTLSTYLTDPIDTA